MPEMRSQPYPAGIAGVKLSLAEMARQMRTARIGPDSDQLRGLAGKALIDAGKPPTTIGKVQALLDCVRSRTVYMPDPVQAEYIVAPAGTLCVRPGLCVPAGDCDDLTVALGALCLAIGLPVRIIKQNFGSAEQEHVLLEVYDDDSGTWIPADPSSDWPAGQKAPAVSEVRIDPMDDAQLGLLANTESNFVGVGRAPVGVGGSWITWVSAGSVQELKDRLNGYVQGLQAVFGSCTSISANTKAAWPPWYTQWQAYYAKVPPWYASAAYQDEAEAWEKDIQGWQAIFSNEGCTGLPTVAAWNADTTASSLPSVVKVIAISAVMIAAAVVVYKVVDLSSKAAITKPPTTPKKNPLPRGTAVQSLLFSNERFTPTTAARWAHRHGYKTTYGLDITVSYIRIRQHPPRDFERDSFRTIPFGRNTGIKAVIGTPRD